MTKFMTPSTSNDEFIRYEIDQEEFVIPAEGENDLPAEAEVLDRFVEKWFARMSADGYLDTTEWEGPHESEDQALYDLYVLYGQDNETFFDFIGEGKLIEYGSLHLAGLRNELYGRAAEDGTDVWLATMGIPVGYDPNDDHELPEAYDFEIVDPAKVKVYRERYALASI